MGELVYSGNKRVRSQVQEMERNIRADQDRIAAVLVERTDLLAPEIRSSSEPAVTKDATLAKDKGASSKTSSS
jgi:hypothetical protein